MIYMDNAASTRINEKAVGEMLPYLYGEYGNPGALHKAGRKAAQAIEHARGQVAGFLHTEPEHIIFTSGGSEGNNMILKGLSWYLKFDGKTTIVTTPIEHPSVLRVMDELAGHGFTIRYLPVTQGGYVNTEYVLDAIDDSVGLVSIMYVNNETGAVNPVPEIAKICRQKGVLFHSDCVQAAAAFDIDAESIGFDFATLSAHKLHGPKGVGAVYVRDRKLFKLMSPLIHGGKTQEYGMRGGTENVAGIVGFGTACQYMEYPKNFRTMFICELSKALLTGPSSEWHIYSNGAVYTSGNILNLQIKGVDAETLVMLMDMNGVAISAGSACHEHSVEPSHVLRAMGLSDEQARSSVRISVSSYQSAQDIIEAAHIMGKCIRQLRAKE